MDGWTNGGKNGKADGQRVVSCKVWWLFSLEVDKNTNFDINVELRHNRTVDRRTDKQTDEWKS